MFISNAEKETIFNTLKNLEIRIYELEKFQQKEAVKKKVSTKKAARLMSEAHKAKIRAAHKARFEKMKAAKEEVSGVPV